MKTILLLVMFLAAAPLQAACKCNCNPADRSICASSTDLDKPCGGLCPSQAPDVAPSLTACPMIELVNPVTGVKTWGADCR